MTPIGSRAIYSGAMATQRDVLRKLLATDPQKAADLINKVRKGRIELARENPSFFCEYVLRDETNGKAIQQEPPHEEIQQLFEDHNRIVVWTHPGLGKCSPGNEYVLLPDGTEVRLSTIKERTHILTFDPSSLSYKVVEAGPAVPDEFAKVHLLELANGRTIRATGNHPVYVEHQGWTPIGVVQLGQRVMSLLYDPAPHKSEEAIPAHEAWMMGFMLTLNPAAQMLQEIQRQNPLSAVLEKTLKDQIPRGSMLRWDVEPSAHNLMRKHLEQFGCYMRTMGETIMVCHDRQHPNFKENLGDLSKSLGIGCGMYKRIPRKIRQATQANLLTFFQGIFCGEKTRMRKAFRHNLPYSLRITSVANAKRLVLFLRQLATQAGLHLGVTSAPSSLPPQEYKGIWESKKYKEPGREHKQRVPDDVIFTVHDSPTVERLWGIPTAQRPAAMELVPVVANRVLKEKTQTYALPVHDPCACYISGGILCHNTNQISIGRTLWLLGNDPNKTILIISNTREAATRIIGAIKRYIEESPELQEVFPHLKPGKRWSESAIEVNRSVIRKTPSVVAVGLHGSIMGLRADEIILDDVDGPESTSTKHAKEQAMTWVERSALSRLNPSGGRVGAIGNVWADDDILHKLARKAGYSSRKFPVVDEDGEPLLPKRFPPDVVQQIRIDTTPLRFAQIYMCEARDEASSLFKDEWINSGCEAGEGKTLMNSLPSSFNTALVYTGVDLGVRQSKGSDPTVLVTAILHPDKRRQVVSVRYGVWTAHEIAENIRRQYEAFGGSILVENNGAQQFLLDLLTSQGGGNVPVKGFQTTGKNKYEPVYGVESLAKEIASGQWIFPSSDGTYSGCEPAMQWLLDACRAYTRGKHTPDGLMAMWICREAMRAEPAKKARVRVGRLQIRPR